MIHEDDRRTLESFPEAKIIKVKQDTVIGQHYHKIKTERFILLEGKCKLIIKSTSEPVSIKGKNNTLILKGEYKMKKGEIYVIEPNIYHEFEIKKDSILLGFNSHPYDPTDDYKL